MHKALHVDVNELDDFTDSEILESLIATIKYSGDDFKELELREINLTASKLLQFEPSLKGKKLTSLTIQSNVMEHGESKEIIALEKAIIKILSSIDLSALEKLVLTWRSSAITELLITLNQCQSLKYIGLATISTTKNFESLRKTLANLKSLECALMWFHLVDADIYTYLDACNFSARLQKRNIKFSLDYHDTCTGLKRTFSNEIFKATERNFYAYAYSLRNNIPITHIDINNETTRKILAENIQRKDLLNKIFFYMTGCIFLPKRDSKILILLPNLAQINLFFSGQQTAIPREKLMGIMQKYFQGANIEAIIAANSLTIKFDIFKLEDHTSFLEGLTNLVLAAKNFDTQYSEASYDIIEHFNEESLANGYAAVGKYNTMQRIAFSVDMKHLLPKNAQSKFIETLQVANQHSHYDLIELHHLSLTSEFLETLIETIKNFKLSRFELTSASMKPSTTKDSFYSQTMLQIKLLNLLNTIKPDCLKELNLYWADHPVTSLLEMINNRYLALESLYLNIFSSLPLEQINEISKNISNLKNLKKLTIKFSTNMLELAHYVAIYELALMLLKERENISFHLIVYCDQTDDKYTLTSTDRNTVLSNRYQHAFVLKYPTLYPKNIKPQSKPQHFDRVLLPTIGCAALPIDKTQFELIFPNEDIVSLNFNNKPTPIKRSELMTLISNLLAQEGIRYKQAGNIISINKNDILINSSQVNRMAKKIKKAIVEKFTSPPEVEKSIAITPQKPKIFKKENDFKPTPKPPRIRPHLLSSGYSTTTTTTATKLKLRKGEDCAIAKLKERMAPQQESDSSSSSGSEKITATTLPDIKEMTLLKRQDDSPSHNTAKSKKKKKKKNSSRSVMKLDEFSEWANKQTPKQINNCSHQSRKAHRPASTQPPTSSTTTPIKSLMGQQPHNCRLFNPPPAAPVTKPNDKPDADDPYGVISFLEL